ncbi:hypothetical protein CLV40_107182 [Actinokineospora auranticolor]|uniref:Uncharacterized protein n=1 Tax=Actinokineospora auranticolor TaxID=155976 RepID=A0A2S6GQI0_9PSEU|nr:hypothetical protein CLV40_107182 [Actinokineospora auranticolor]
MTLVAYYAEDDGDSGLLATGGGGPVAFGGCGSRRDHLARAAMPARRASAVRVLMIRSAVIPQSSARSQP